MNSPVTIRFAHGHYAQALKIESESGIDFALSALGLIANRPVLVVIGGASLISEEDLQR